jgi:tetratricopeptide (TPR) repeat protein
VLRGELHERFADWLAARGEAYDEFVGYHLERAFRYRSEVEGIDAASLAIAGRAVDTHWGAGRKALARGDMNAAVSLLRSAADLLQATGESQPEVLLDFGSALSESDVADAEQVLRAALEQAPSTASALRARISIELSYWRSRADPSVHVDEIHAVAEEAIGVFEQVGDQGGLARAWLHIGWAHWYQSHAAEMEPALERAIVHAERAGERRERSTALTYLARCYVYGPRPVHDATARCHTLLARAEGDVPTTAHINALLAILEAMAGRFRDARERWRHSKQRLVELGLSHTAARAQMAYGFVELIANSPEMAEPELTDACEAFERIGDQSRLSSAAAILARLLYAGGRYQQADDYTRIAEAAASEDDIEPQVFWRGTRAKILARAGQAGLAEKLSDGAVALARETDFLLHHAAALSDRSEVMALLGRSALAARDLDDAVAIYERKGIAPSGRTARRHLQALIRDSAVSATHSGPA